MKVPDWAQGWIIWAGAALLTLSLPGKLWKAAQAPPFPATALPATLLALALLAAATLGITWLGGPALSHRRGLALLESPPELLWGGLTLALWPSAWGPPGMAAWALALLLTLLPGEVRWLAQAMPGESPFPQAWGPRALRLSRAFTLRRLAPRWLGVRLPLWITATLILERILGIRGLGGDWFDRVALRDTGGLLVWVLVYALLWTLAHRLEASR